LTDQQARVWVMLKFGMSYQEIADNLRITTNTVKTHARKIYNKQRNHRPQTPRLWFLADPLICQPHPSDDDVVS
jgi:DNA-directed RNA polymerase specialized sigma24 family protein